MRKLSRRQFFRLGAATTTTAILAACGGAPTPNSESGNAAADQQPTQPPAQAGATKITWLVRSDLGTKVKQWFETTVQDYQKEKPSTTVELLSVPWADYNAKLLSMYAAGQPPEVSANFAAGFATFYVNDAIQPLDEYIKARNEKVSDTIEQAALDAVTRDGKLYALPIAHMPVALFYNRRMLKEKGIEPPPASRTEKNWTTDQMLEIAKQISHDVDDPTKAEWGLVFPAQQLGIASWLWGADPFNATGGPQDTEAYKTGKVTEAHYTRSEMITTIQWLQDLSYKHKVAPTPTDTDAMTQSAGWPFLSNRVGMYADGSWQVQGLRELNPSWEWGIAPLPYGPGNTNLTPLFNDSFMLSKNCPHPEEGFDFLWYLAAGPAAKNYADITGFFPANKAYYDTWLDSTMKISGFSLAKEDLRSIMVDVLDYGFPAPGKTLDRYVELNNTWTQTSAPIWSNETDAANGLKAVQDQITKLIS